MKKLGFISILALVQACTSNLHTPMDLQTRQSVEAVRLYNVVVQDEVIPAVQVSNSSSAGAAAGLIGMAIAANIDASKNKKRNREAGAIIEPLWNATMDMDYRQLAAQATNQAVGEQFKILNPRDSAHYAILSRAEISEKVNALEAGTAFIYMLPRYGFVDDSKKLRTTLSTLMYTPESRTANGAPKPKYQSFLVHESTSVGSGGADSITLWLAEDADFFRAKIRNGLSSLGYLLEKDLSGAYEACSAPSSVMAENALTHKTVLFKGVLLEETNTLKSIRVKDGTAYSIEKDGDIDAPENTHEC